VGARDAGQLGIEQAGRGEQVVALDLQRDTHRADASCVLRLAGRWLRDDEVEQLPPRRQGRAGQGQNVVVQPVHECPDVVGEPMRMVLTSANIGPRGNVNIQCIASLISVETHR